MERMFSKMMEGCMKGMSEEEMKAMQEKMKACCGSKMEMMLNCFKESGSAADRTCCGEKS